MNYTSRKYYRENMQVDQKCPLWQVKSGRLKNRKSLTMINVEYVSLRDQQWDRLYSSSTLLAYRKNSTLKLDFADDTSLFYYSIRHR